MCLNGIIVIGALLSIGLLLLLLRFPLRRIHTHIPGRPGLRDPLVPPAPLPLPAPLLPVPLLGR